MQVRREEVENIKSKEKQTYFSKHYKSHPKVSNAYVHIHIVSGIRR